MNLLGQILPISDKLPNCTHHPDEEIVFVCISHKCDLKNILCCSCIDQLPKVHSHQFISLKHFNSLVSKYNDTYKATIKNKMEQKLNKFKQILQNKVKEIEKLSQSNQLYTLQQNTQQIAKRDIWKQIIKLKKQNQNTDEAISLCLNKISQKIDKQILNFTQFTDSIEKLNINQQIPQYDHMILSNDIFEEQEEIAERKSIEDQAGQENEERISIRSQIATKKISKPRKKRAFYTEQFKRKIVLQIGKRQKIDIAQSNNVSMGTLRKWQREYCLNCN